MPGCTARGARRLRPGRAWRAWWAGIGYLDGPLTERSPSTRRVSAAALCLLLGLLLVAGAGSNGCRSVGGAVRLETAEGLAGEGGRPHRVLKTDLDTFVYRAPDSQTAEIYMTDLHPDELDPSRDLSGVSGQLVQVTLFIMPRAGSTPIENTANTALVRSIVVARGQVGVYGGGGFLYPSGDPGDPSFGGSIDRASMRFLAGTPGFADILGPAELSGSFRARLDEPSAELLARRFRELLATAHAGKAP